MQSTSKREVLVYCPNCSVQNPLDEALLGTNVICKKCGHPFIAKKPKTKSSIFNNIWVRGLCVIVTLVVASLIKDTVSELINNITPRGKEKKDYALIMQSIDEYTIRLRQYGQTMRNSGILDIYCSQTCEELLGKKDPKKYRRAIERSLDEAKSLHSWCEQKLKTFNPQMLTEEGEKAKSMVREVYTSYYELTTIGIRLFSKTLECHQIGCGLRLDSSSQDRDATRIFMNKKRNSDSSEAFSEMAEEVMKIAAEYSSLEKEKIAKMETYRDLFKKDK